MHVAKLLGRVGVTVTLMGAAVMTTGACAKNNPTTTGFTDADAGDDAAPPTTTDGTDASLGMVNDAGSIFAKCATATANVLHDPIYMLIVLDGSGSMSLDQKWNAVVPALESLINDLEYRADPSFGLGLTVFSDTNDPTAGVGPYPTIDVPIAFVDKAHATALRARLDGAMPRNQTPTLAVMSGQYPALENFQPVAPLLPNGKKVMVLMTDGVPYPNSDTQKPACITLAGNEFAKTAPAGPVTTFAVGIGYFFPYSPTEYDVQFMGALAQAGGAATPGCDPNELQNADNMCHFQVTPSAAQTPDELELEFAIAFDKIRSRVLSCDLTLDKKSGTLLDPGSVNVVFTDALGNTTVFHEDPTDGWSYDNPTNPTKVVLNGKACAELKDNPRGDIQVILGCKSIVN